MLLILAEEEQERQHKVCGSRRSRMASTESPSATPSCESDNSIKGKYCTFVQKVKLSARHAKNKAQHKRRLLNKIKSYKRNDQMQTNAMKRKRFTLYTTQCNDAAKTSSSEEINNEEQKENGIKDIMQDDWTCIVIKKTSPSMPKQAPPPIPHSRRFEFLEEKKKTKRKFSDSVQNLFKRTKKSCNDESVNEENTSYDENAFNLDSGLEERMKDDSHNELLESDDASKEKTALVVQWQWCDDQEKWNNFGKRTSKEIEENYTNKLDEYEYDVFGNKYIINFIDLKQYNNLNQTWNVRRELVHEKCR